MVWRGLIRMLDSILKKRFLSQIPPGQEKKKSWMLRKKNDILDVIDAKKLNDVLAKSRSRESETLC